MIRRPSSRAPRGQVKVTERMREAHDLVRRQGLTYAQAGERFGVSRTCIEGWLTKVEDQAADERALRALGR